MSPAPVESADSSRNEMRLGSCIRLSRRIPCFLSETLIRGRTLRRMRSGECGYEESSNGGSLTHTLFVKQMFQSESFGLGFQIVSKGFVACWVMAEFSRAGEHVCRQHSTFNLFCILGENGELIPVFNIRVLFEEAPPHLEPIGGELWGNYPQTYSMVGLILCAMRLSSSWEKAF